ncbi:hypothetical protein OCU04_011816 [Sclerotinia nivalis]|uniref:Uncharacterized protein n=1 Tax=Sclerotinia nivalis TaxID=352851 RepID=A0A9X0DDT4_9HELO|nr:hypothetical protein OCU04_011816 [Sclerotinia nivalis]
MAPAVDAKLAYFQAPIRERKSLGRIFNSKNKKQIMTEAYCNARGLSPGSMFTMAVILGDIVEPKDGLYPMPRCDSHSTSPVIRGGRTWSNSLGPPNPNRRAISVQEYSQYYSQSIQAVKHDSWTSHYTNAYCRVSEAEITEIGWRFDRAPNEAEKKSYEVGKYFLQTSFLSFLPFAILE